MTPFPLTTPTPALTTLPIPPPDPKKEYVAGGPQAYLGYVNYLRALPHSIDDISQELKVNIYLEMMKDSQANASANIFQASIVEDGARQMPAVSNPKATGYKKAQKILEFCQNQLDNLEGLSFREVLFAMSECLVVGNKVAELVWEEQTSTSIYLGQPNVTTQQTALRLKAIKPKPRDATAFVVDPYLNVVGLLARIPGVSWSANLGMLVFGTDKADLPVNLLPREKFAVMTWRSRDGDPRGTSALRPAYDPWWRKQQIKGEHLKYLAQFASPSLIGILQPGAQRVAVLAPDGTPTGTYLEPSVAMAQQLATFRNGTYIVVANGAEVKPIIVPGDGAAFLHALAECNREMVRAILTQTLATEEGEHSSRAQASVHQDALDTIIRQGKAGMEEMIRRDILRKIVLYNFGEQYLPLTPFATLGQLEAPDASKIWSALAQLATSGYLDPSQYTDLDSAVGLPARDPSSTMQPIQPTQQQNVTQGQTPVQAPVS